MSKQKVVHLNFSEEDHQKLKEAATQYDMPMATYAKTVVLAHIQGDKEEVATPPVPAEEVYIRKPRTVKRFR